MNFDFGGFYLMSHCVEHRLLQFATTFTLKKNNRFEKNFFFCELKNSSGKFCFVRI